MSIGLGSAIRSDIHQQFEARESARSTSCSSFAEIRTCVDARNSVSIVQYANALDNVEK
jgi:hypothetical protein